MSFSLGVKLQSVPNLAIMRPSSPAMLKETDAAKWARDTGANLLVQPAVRQMGDTRQLSFSISLAGSPVQIAAGEVTGPAAEHFRLEDELTQKLVAALKVHLATGGAVPTPAPASVPAGAPQTDYVVALGHLEHYDDKDSVEKAISLLTRIPGGESSALVQAALGRAYLASYNLTKDVAFAGLAQQAAQRASALDPDLPEAQVTLGEVLTATGRSGEAITIIRKAARPGPELRAGDPRPRGGAPEGPGRGGGRADAPPPRGAPAHVLGRLQPARQPLLPEQPVREGGRGLPARDRPEPGRRAGFTSTSGRSCCASAGSRRPAPLSTTRSGSAPCATAYSNLGVAHYLLGRFPEAAASFQRAVDLAPKNYRWLHRPRRRALADSGPGRACARRVRGGAPARDAPSSR